MSRTNGQEDIPISGENPRPKDGSSRPKLVSIVIPCYNEEDVLEQLGVELTALMDRHPRYDFEVVLVENGSWDGSIGIMRGLNEKDPRFKIVQLSRNFMADGGVAAGLRHASGDCAVLMDADLQDPPEVVDQFLEQWEEGHDVVYGVIRSRQGLSRARKLANKLFYATLNKITKGVIPPSVTAFRLMDRKVYRQLNAMGERNRFTRGLCSWTGFRQTGVEFDRAERFAGESKAPFTDIAKEAMDAIVSFSSFPLKLITVFGVLLAAFCFLFLFYQIGASLFFGGDFAGYLTLITTMLMMFGFLFLSLGVMGEYLSRIYDEVKRRPIYIVRDHFGFDDETVRQVRRYEDCGPR